MGYCSANGLLSYAKHLFTQAVAPLSAWRRPTMLSKDWVAEAAEMLAKRAGYRPWSKPR
jgi:hypothetical protein